MLLRRLKQAGIKAQKGFDKKRKIRESEVTKSAMTELRIETLLSTISEWEAKLQAEKTSQTVNHLIALYNKAVEYYSALNDDRHMEYLLKVKNLFQDDQLMQSIEISDAATVDPQSSTQSAEETPEESKE